jgi:hypothetical protein
MLAVGSERNCSMRFSNIGDNMPYCTILSHRWSGREENERRERQKERERERGQTIAAYHISMRMEDSHHLFPSIRCRAQINDGL